MFYVQALLAMGVVLATVLVAGGRGDGLGPLPAHRSPARSDLPADRAVSGRDVVDVRLGVAARGYRMDDVDDVLDRLADELDARDAEIARLRGAPPPAPRPTDP